MAKLVVLNEGLAGQSYELKVVKTTIGRVDDNAFPIVQGSVSSHHAEITLRGNEVVVKDLNSTNGTFINGQQLASGSEAVLKPGQILKLGQVELKLDTGTGSTPPAAAAAGAPAASPAPTPPPAKPLQSTMVISKGVSLEQLEQGGHGGFDTSKGGFTKKSNKTNKIFIIGGVVFALVIVVLFAVIFQMLKSK